VELIFAKAPNVKKAEDRSQFREPMRRIVLVLPKSFIISNIEESWNCLTEFKLPMFVRSSFTLGCCCWIKEQGLRPLELNMS
jgi:carbamoyl-phosphate synthase large subunit